MAKGKNLNTEASKLRALKEQLLVQKELLCFLMKNFNPLTCSEIAHAVLIRAFEEKKALERKIEELLSSNTDVNTTDEDRGDNTSHTSYRAMEEEIPPPQTSGTYDTFF